MQILESLIEKKFVKLLAQLGVETIKLNLQGNTGWPDRLVIVPGGSVIWIELKRPGEEPTKLQLYRHGQLRERNHDVRVFDDADKAAAYVAKAVDS